MKSKLNYGKTLKILFTIGAIIILGLFIISLIVLYKTYFGDENTNYEGCRDYFQSWIDFYTPIMGDNNVFAIVTIIVLNPVSNIISQIVIYKIKSKEESENGIVENESSLKPYILKGILYTVILFLLMGLILCNYGVCNAGVGQANREIARIEKLKSEDNKIEDKPNFNDEYNQIEDITFDFNDPLFCDYTYDDIANNYYSFTTAIKIALKTKTSLPDKSDEKIYIDKVTLADGEYRKGNTIYSLILRKEANEYKLDAENVYLIGICLKDLADEAYNKNDLEAACEAYTSALSYNLLALQYLYTYTLNSNTTEYNLNFIINVFDRINENLDGVCLSSEKNSNEYLKAKLFKILYNKEKINNSVLKNIELDNFNNYEDIKEFLIFELDKNIKKNQIDLK